MSDRRKASIRLNEAEAKRIQILYQKMGEGTADLLESYSEEELRVLASYFKKSLAFIQTQHSLL